MTNSERAEFLYERVANAVTELHTADPSSIDTIYIGGEGKVGEALYDLFVALWNTMDLAAKDRHRGLPSE